VFSFWMRPTKICNTIGQLPLELTYKKKAFKVASLALDARVPQLCSNKSDILTQGSLQSKVLHEGYSQELAWMTYFGNVPCPWAAFCENIVFVTKVLVLNNSQKRSPKQTLKDNFRLAPTQWLSLPLLNYHRVF
jgi:hypothetical protein